MFSTLAVGDRLSVLTRGRSRPLAAVLVAKSDQGALSLALVPSTPRRQWRPLLVDRWNVTAVWRQS